jgi:hypothetical protein
VLTRLGKFLVVFALVLMTGAHWAALQTAAWTTMLADHLRTQNFSQAVSETFDGAHPCCLCKAIAAAKKAQKTSAAATPVLKMEFPPLAASVGLFPPARFELRSQCNWLAEASFLKPPVPPPRSRFA